MHAKTCSRSRCENPLIIQPCDIKWQTKRIIFLLPQYLWLPNLPYCDRLSPLQPNDSLITWPMWGHMTTRIYHIQFPFMVTKLAGKKLILMRRFSKQTLKSPTTSGSLWWDQKLLLQITYKFLTYFITK